MKTCLTHLNPVLPVILVSRITESIGKKWSIGFNFLRYEKFVLTCDLLTLDSGLHAIHCTEYARIQVRENPYSSIFYLQELLTDTIVW